METSVLKGVVSFLVLREVLRGARDRSRQDLLLAICIALLSTPAERGVGVRPAGVTGEQSPPPPGPETAYPATPEPAVPAEGGEEERPLGEGRQASEGDEGEDSYPLSENPNGVSER